jgi:hypothetical protein
MSFLEKIANLFDQNNQAKKNTQKIPVNADWRLSNWKVANCFR